jgi:hypothetical protein
MQESPLSQVLHHENAKVRNHEKEDIEDLVVPLRFFRHFVFSRFRGEKAFGPAL